MGRHGVQTLTEIMNECGTDKGTVIAEAHGYTVFYERWFDPIRETPLRLLEIGVCDPSFPGASLNAWHEYFPNAQIFGYDIADTTRFRQDRIMTFRGDQSSAKDLKRFIEECGSGFDIIIDDGSHIADHQQASLGFLFDHVKPGGQYIIEDMQVAPDTVQVMLELQRRVFGIPAWKSLFRIGELRRTLKNQVRTVRDVLLRGRVAHHYLSCKDISRLAQEIESIEVVCDNKLARIVIHR